MARLQTGDPAPTFSLLDADGVAHSLADYAGGRVIVYFYPAAMTPGCTTQAIDFTTHSAEFGQAGYTVVGISPYSPAKLAAFRSKENLDVLLLSDEDKAVDEGLRRLRHQDVVRQGDRRGHPVHLCR